MDSKLRSTQWRLAQSSASHKGIKYGRYGLVIQMRLGGFRFNQDFAVLGVVTGLGGSEAPFIPRSSSAAIQFCSPSQDLVTWSILQCLIVLAHGVE